MGKEMKPLVNAALCTSLSWGIAPGKGEKEIPRKHHRELFL
jgi:hypothetical protein